MIPLMPPEDQNQAIALAFRKDSPWVWDTAFGSCRNLGHIDDETHEAVRKYILRMSVGQLTSRYDDLHFSLSLSDAFRNQRHGLVVDTAAAVTEIVLSTAFALAVVVRSPFEIAVLMTASFAAASHHFSHGLVRRLTGVPRRRHMGWVFAEMYEFMGARDWFMGTFRVFAFLAAFMLLPRLVLATAPSRRPIAEHLLLIGSVGVPLAAACAGSLVVQRQHSSHSIRDMAFRAGTVLLVLAFGAGCAEIMTLALAWLSESARYWMAAICFTLTGTWILIQLVRGIPAGLRSISARAQEVREWRRLRRMAWPEACAPTAVFATAQSFTSLRVRRAYLEGIRLRRVRMEGAIVDLPDGWLSDRAVEEEVARLREQWFEMAE
jgi:hypothetical protein